MVKCTYTLAYIRIYLNDSVMESSIPYVYIYMYKFKDMLNEFNNSLWCCRLNTCIYKFD